MSVQYLAPQPSDYEPPLLTTRPWLPPTACGRQTFLYRPYAYDPLATKCGGVHKNKVLKVPSILPQKMTFLLEKFQPGYKKVFDNSSS